MGSFIAVKMSLSKTNTVWTGGDNSSFASPIGFKNKLYVVTSGVATVVDAKTGERIQRLRLRGAKPSGGRFGSLDYPSPIIVGDRLFYMNGSGQMYVFELEGEMKQVALNQLTTDSEVFWGTPAVSDGRMAIRSSKHLYCVTDKGDQVDQSANEMAQADEPAAEENGNGGGGRAGGGGRGQNFDPVAMFNGLDKDQDGQVTETELEGNRMADRLKTLDKDADKSISKDEFQSGITTLFNRGGGGGGGYGNGGKDTRPDRPQRPAAAEGS